MSNRNAIKYRPFAAVEGYFEKLEEVTKKHYLIEKPIPGEDDIDRINRALSFSLQNKEPITLIVFNKGKIDTHTDIITNYNNINKTLLLSDYTKKEIENIVDVE